MNELKNNLKNLLRTADISENELARRTGIPQQAINRLLSGTNTNPKIATLLPLAKYFKVSLSELLGDELQSKQEWQLIPLISWELISAESLGKLILTTEEKILADISENEGIYASKMNDDSMEPKFSEGTTLIFDSNKKPSNGDFVLLLSFAEGLNLRQLIFKDNALFKKSLNRKYKDFKLTILSDKTQILGVLIQSRTNHLE